MYELSGIAQWRLLLAKAKGAWMAMNLSMDKFDAHLLGVVFSYALHQSTLRFQINGILHEINQEVGSWTDVLDLRDKFVTYFVREKDAPIFGFPAPVDTHASL